jgi:hypothetical protein
MRTAAFIAASSFALASLVAAAPVNNKRDIVYSTTTEEVWETIWTTTTLWVDPSATATTSSVGSVGGFYEEHSTETYTTPAVVTTSSVSTAAPVVQAAPVTTSSTSVYVAPAPTSTYVAPAPAPTTTTTNAYVAPTPVPVASATPSAASGGGSSGTVGDHTGDITYYSVEVGAGSCGTNGLDSQPLVALAKSDMANGANPNANPKCGKQINIYYNGAVHTATIHDTCPECTAGSLDLTKSLFDAVAPGGDGRVHGVTWSYA